MEVLRLKSEMKSNCRPREPPSRCNSTAAYRFPSSAKLWKQVPPRCKPTFQAVIKLVVQKDKLFGLVFFYDHYL
jgi:hypothetical protein